MKTPPPPQYTKKRVTLQNITLGENVLFCEKKYLTKKYNFLSFKVSNEEERVNLLPQQTNVFYLGVKDVENSKPVFDADFHTELIIKDEYEDCNLGNMETYIIIEKKPQII